MLRSRNEMNPEFMWDFTTIFESEEAWEKAYAQIEKDLPALAAKKGTLSSSPSAMKEALDALYSVAERMELVYLYAMLQKNADNSSDENQAREEKAMKLYISFSTVLSFVDPEIVAMDSEKLESFIADPCLEKYVHILKDTARAREHTLDEAREIMLAKLSSASRTPSNAFDMFESVDMVFPKIKDEEGNEVQITHGNFGVFRESKNREIRREAFEKYFGEYGKFINTLATLYTGSVKFNTYYADVKNFNSAIEASLFSTNVPTDVYYSLINAVHKGIPYMTKYIELRRRVLGLDEVNMYDMYSPMVESVDFKVSYEEAKVLIKKALEPFGEKYAALLDRAYNEKWMDVYENKGKTTGAFSCGVYGVHPYVLLNYTDTLDDAFTMAHELGHAMHSYLSSEKQDYCNSDYKITVAEVASTVNEVMLTKYLLATETDPARRAYILNHFLEGFRTTVYRQTLFAEFEMKVHEMCVKGEPLTASTLNSLYRSLNEKYYAGAVINDFIDIEWARIPHFYRAFYVYQYATGFSCAVAIANNILKTGDASGYLEFLASGGSDYPLEELKIAGVDLSKPETVENALEVFNEMIDELAKLL